MQTNRLLSKLYTIKDLRNGSIKEIPKTSGVYFILMPLDFPLHINSETDGSKLTSKGDPSVYPIEKLLKKVKHYEMEEPLKSHLLYIGSSNNIKRRINQYINPYSNHSGGRDIWQLENSEDLLVSYIECSTEKESEELEHRLLISYKNIYGTYPFANWRS